MSQNPASRTRSRRRFLILFNHTLTSEQHSQADQEFEYPEIVVLPPDLKQLWGQIPTDGDTLEDILLPFYDWMGKNGRPGDVVLIQGEFGATFSMVTHALKKGLIPVYATTKRKAQETQLPDGTIKTTHVFQFCRFRRYSPGS